MSSQRSSADLSDDALTWTEKQGLIEGDTSLPKWDRRRFHPSTHLVTAYLSNSIMLIITLVLAIKLAQRPYLDPTVGVYCEHPSLYSLFLSFILFICFYLNLWLTDDDQHPPTKPSSISKRTNSAPLCSRRRHIWVIRLMKPIDSGKTYTIVSTDKLAPDDHEKWPKFTCANAR